MPYPARAIPLDARDFASHKSLQRIAAFNKDAGNDLRQVAIDYVVTAHGFSQKDTLSLVYDSGLDQPGRNVGGDIRIGPPAFEQDLTWLAGIVYHELIHSPQYTYYAAKGVTKIDPKRSNVERLMIALDEYEAYSWTLKRSAELSLSKSQQDTIRDRAGLFLIDLDDAKANQLARNQQYDAARDELIRQYNAKAPAPRASIGRRHLATCCA